MNSKHLVLICNYINTEQKICLLITTPVRIGNCTIINLFWISIYILIKNIICKLFLCFLKNGWTWISEYLYTSQSDGQFYFRIFRQQSWLVTSYVSHSSYREENSSIDTANDDNWPKPKSCTIFNFRTAFFLYNNELNSRTNKFICPSNIFKSHIVTSQS